VVLALDFNVQLEMVKDGNDLLNRLLTPGNKLPDLVLLDLNMPNKNGRECLEIIRQTEHLKKLRVIIYSTSSSPNDINDTYAKGANLYITKPASFMGLISMTKKLFMIDWEDYLPHSPRRNFVLSFQDF
jgi:CheY-like chemotaxis protein